MAFLCRMENQFSKWHWRKCHLVGDGGGGGEQGGGVRALGMERKSRASSLFQCVLQCVLYLLQHFRLHPRMTQLCPFFFGTRLLLFDVAQPGTAWHSLAQPGTA